MKNIITILLLSCTFAIQAQRPSQERVKALKVAFLTEELDLSATEAQKFWPIYNVYESTMDEVRTAERKIHKSLGKNFDSLSEEDAKKTISSINALEEKKANARETLISQLRNTLSYKKTLILMRSEEAFRRKLFRQLRDGRRGNGDKSRSRKNRP